MKNKRGGINKKGISLIVLIITIIVIIILAGAIILNLTNNNPIDNARKAKFLNDVDTFKSDLSLYELNKMGSTEGNYNPKALNADKNSVSENGEVDTQRTIIDVISSMKDTKYEEKLEVIAGELVYVGDSEKESNWLDGVIESKNFKMNIVTVPDMNKISGKVTLSGFLVDETKIEYYRIYISQTAGTYPDTPSVEITDKKKEVEFEINNLVANTEYYIKVELKMSNEPDVRVLESGKIITKPDSVVPNTPQITVPGYSNNYTITPITITLTDDEGGSGISKTNSKYIIDKTATSYNEEDSMWQSATGFLGEEFTGNTATVGVSVVEEGEYYVHVLAVDNARNKKSGISGKIVVDTLIPNEAGITIPTTTTTNSIDATVVLNDNENGSGIDLSKCKYIYSTVSYPYGDTETIWDTGTVFTSQTQTITVTSSTNEIYYLHVLLVDKAGNRREVLSSGVTTNTETPVAPAITGTIATNTWTNQNVTLTVNEVTSPGITRYEYSVNGGAWQTYNATNKVVVTSEGTSTVKARAVNNVGTVGAESTGYIVKIDRTAPSNPTVDLSGYASGTWTNGNVTQTFSSSDSYSGVQKYQYTVDGGATWSDCPNPWIINWDGGWNFYIRAIDNIGNVSGASDMYTIYRDATAPTYTSYEINNVTETGYDVYLYGVSDNFSGINRVQFPTTSPSSGWIWNYGTDLGNGTWHYRVNVSDFSNVPGQYQTHIYLYDYAGNYSALATSGAIIPEQGLNLYNYGDQCTSVTGGWTIKYGNQMMRSGWGGSSSYVSYQYNTNNINLAFSSMGSYQYTSTANRAIGICTNSPINISGYKYLNVLCDVNFGAYTSHNPSQNYFTGDSILTSTSNVAGYTDNYATASNYIAYGTPGGSAANYKLSVDISGISGLQYITNFIGSDLEHYNSSGNITIYRIWLSK